ncbi:MAG: leucine-rich repeat domain-containing protein, partial [Ruminococcus sp.]|nr:leucine-rich repeat domain-containing protein [Ruminococcus sp.]
MPLKKFLAVLAAVCLTLSMVGCQQNDDVSTGQTDTEQTISETQQTTETTTEQTEQTVENAETSETETSAESEANIAETVIIAGQEFSVGDAAVTIEATIDGVDISEITFIKNLQILELLNVEEGYSYVTGFNSISEMENLEELYIKGVHIKSDFENIQYCQKLKKLYLDLTPIYDISCIENLTYLEEIYICNASITDITPLSSLKHLKKVSIIETNISDLSPLECLDNLEYIYISCNS